MSYLCQCVVCGRSFIDGRHKCPAKKIKRKDTEARRSPPAPQEPTYDERLDLGFKMLQQQGVEYALSQWP